jgi:ADP-heptose:LPS heptosyltransferase/glycosyltransferase involved in cell wall biosynthesis
LTKIKNIVISGTNFWNPGDDFVRDGVIRILRKLFPEHTLNFLFYNFNQDFFPHRKFSGIHNMLAQGDLEKCTDFIDAVVIAGLSAGEEIKDLYRWIIENKLDDRVYLISAGYENSYVDKHIYQEPELTIFKNAKVITGRTAKKPRIIDELNLPYFHINCPAILSVENTKIIPPDKKIEKIAFSIQLSHEIGISNQSCHHSMYELGYEIFSQLYGNYDIDFIAHHKSEYFHHLNIFQTYNLSIPVIFSSFYQDLFEIYKNYDLIITTRLHASLFANGFGIPGIIINDTDRHTHTLDGFPHSVWINSIQKFTDEFNRFKEKDLSKISIESELFKENLMNKYIEVLAPAFGINLKYREEELKVPSHIISNEMSDNKFRNALIEFIMREASSIEVKKRVLEVFQKLEKDYWLEKNIENFKNLIDDNNDSNFDLVCFLNWYAYNFNPENYLEIGVRRGRSLAQVMTQSRFTDALGIDLWIEDYSTIPEKNIFTSNPGPEFVIKELKKFHITHLPKLIRGNSHEILPSLFNNPEIPDYFELIVVDGDHGYAGAKQDLEITNQHLKPGGILVFDDITHPSHPELRILWNEFKEQNKKYIFLEDLSGNGTGIAIKPPFDKFENFIYYENTIIPEKNDDDYTFLLKEDKTKSEIPAFAGMTTDLKAVQEMPAFAGMTADVRMTTELPVHFFTIVLNGKPFINYHIEMMKKLPFRWHWHIIEGVADLKHDTGWSLQYGGKIHDELHKNGLSNDGTSEYIDELYKLFPKNISIYRKPSGIFWDGKLEMVNAPLANINEECILWEIDSDELWTSEQVIKMRELFINQPEKTAAFYLCHFFVGEKLVITSRDTYGNHTDYEWQRTWRYIPGDRWLSHEPPSLCRLLNNGRWVDLSQINSFRYADTASLGLIFQHYAYATEDSVKFKEQYYGYKNATAQWKNLQEQRQFPLFLKDYFAWVNDNAIVNTVESQNLIPIAWKDNEGIWNFGKKAVTIDEKKKILWIRTDAIGDNVLAASMLPYIKEKYPNSVIIAVCQEYIKEFYQACPYVNDIVTYDETRVYCDEIYANTFLEHLRLLNSDIALNTLYSRKPITDIISLASAAKDRIARYGNKDNISEDEWQKNNKYYTLLIESDKENKCELERHSDFLEGIGINSNVLNPLIWLKPEDEKFADNFFKDNELDPKKTIALFAGTQFDIKDYDSIGLALSDICKENDFSIIALGSKDNFEINQKNINEAGVNSFNLSGKISLLQSASILKHCKLAVGADTGLAHIACAVGIPNVIVMGGGHFGRFIPYSNLTSVVCLPLDCYGCLWHCQYNTNFCIKSISPKILEIAIKQTLYGISEKPRIFVQGNTNWKSSISLPKWMMFDKFVDLNKFEIIQIEEEKPEHPPLSPFKVGQQQFKVSAIVSTHNSEKFIRGCLEDLINQTLFKSGELEIVVIDSGSRQNEKEIVKEFQNKYNNIIYIRTENRESVYEAWNRGIKAARGQYITNANTDDRHRADALELMAKTLDENPEFGLVYTDSFLNNIENETFEETKSMIRYDWPDFNLGTALSNFTFSPHPMWRKSVHESIGYFNSDYTISGDYDFYIRLAHRFGAIHLRETLGLFLQRGDSLSGSDNKMKTIKETLVILKHYREHIPIGDIYHELKNYLNDPLATVAAYWDFASMCMLSPYNDFELAISMYQKSMSQQGLSQETLNQLSLMFQNNAGVLLYCAGDKFKARGMFTNAISLPEAKKNLELINNSERKNSKLAPLHFSISEIKHPVITNARTTFGIMLNDKKELIKTEPHEQIFWDVYTGTNGIQISEEEKRRAVMGLPRIGSNFEEPSPYPLPVGEEKDVAPTPYPLPVGEEIELDEKFKKNPLPQGEGRVRVLFTMYGWNESGGGTTLPKAEAIEIAKKGIDIGVFYAGQNHSSVEKSYYMEKTVDEEVKLFGVFNRPTIFLDELNPEREINDERVVKLFKDVLDEFKPDVIHFQNFLGLSFEIAKIAEEQGIPLLFTPHNYHLIDPRLYMYRNDLSLWSDTDFFSNSELAHIFPEKSDAYEERTNSGRKLLNDIFDFTLAVSKRQKEIFVQFGANPERIAVVNQIHKPIDELLKMKISDKNLHKPLRFGYIGGVMPHKGAHIIIQAAQQFQPGEVEFLIYGFISEIYAKFLKGLDKKGIVQFMGEYKSEQLPDIASELDAMLLPSLWEDCAPLVAAESLAMGLPVIAANIGGIPDFIEDGVNGRLYTYNSWEELTSIIREYINNPGELLNLQKNCSVTYTFENFVEHLIEIYKKLSNRNKLSLDDLELSFLKNVLPSPY